MAPKPKMAPTRARPASGDRANAKRLLGLTHTVACDRLLMFAESALGGLRTVEFPAFGF
jgi:hypothetical protein